MEKTKKRLVEQHQLSGKTVAFFGSFAFWPSYHPGDPSYVAKTRGAKVCETVDENLDYLVLGERRAPDKTEAKKTADKLRKAAEKAAKKGLTVRYPEVIDESAYRAMMRLDVSGKTFCFFGGFDCCGGELDTALLSSMVEGVGAIVHTSVDEELDYLVLGNRRGEGKIIASNHAKKLQAAGAAIEILDEEGFLELVRKDRQVTEDSEEGMSFASFISELHGTVDQGKLGRALKMLKSESFKLYVHSSSERVVGVVRSQTKSDKVYASWLTNEGKYGCSTSDLSECMGLQGSVCKHLLVLVVGLTRAGEINANSSFLWLKSARSKGPRTDSDLVATTFIEYKGAEVGEIDWRPTETIPEDFYAF
jgi:BRCT domain type II-containing protein